MSIYLESNGKWRLELQRNGERYRSRFDSKKEAENTKREVLSFYSRNGMFPLDNTRKTTEEPKTTLKQARRAASSILWRDTSSSLESWSKIDRIVDFFGPDFYLDDITTNHIDALIEELKKTVSDATVNRYLSAFRKFLGWCYDRGYKKSSVSDIKFSWKKETQGRIRWITTHEEAQLYEYLPYTIWCVVKVAIETGCRRSEILSLSSEQVKNTKLHLWKTKNGKPRTISIDNDTYRLICHLLDTGMPTENELTYQWELARIRMGLKGDEDFVFHACRHTCATRLIQAGVNLRVVQEWMGHNDIKTTTRYAHVHDEMLDEALELRKVFNQKTLIEAK